MFLSVIINTFERPRALAHCLEALTRQAGAEPFEVIVVDDGGEVDLEPAVAPVRGGLSLRLERIAHAGRAAARNRGVALARGSRILFLGDDVIAAPECVAIHQSRSDPKIAVVGPYPLKNPCGSPPFRRWAEPNPQHEITDRENAGFWFFATGNLSMDRAVFNDLGGFDPRFTVYGWEDIDLGLRFELAGGRLVFDERAAALHEHPPMTRTALWRREFEMGMTAWQFWDKWGEMTGGQPGKIAKMKFWKDAAPPLPGGILRRQLGKLLIGMLDVAAPDSPLNARLYERMIFAQRLAGVNKQRTQS